MEDGDVVWPGHGLGLLVGVVGRKIGRVESTNL